MTDLGMKTEKEKKKKDVKDKKKKKRGHAQVVVHGK